MDHQDPPREDLILQETDVHAQDVPDKDTGSSMSPRPSLRRRLYVTRHTPTTSTALDPMNVVKMMEEVGLSKEKIEKRTANLSSPQSECRQPAQPNKHIPLLLYEKSRTSMNP